MSGLYLAMYGDKVSIGQAVFISIFAMLIVFVVLLIISYMIDITAFVLKGSNKPKKANGVAESTTSVAPAKKADGSSADVAVIAAAVAAYLGVSVDNIRIQRIRRIDQSISPWSEKGLFTHIK